MNCLEFRRLLLAEPCKMTREHAIHRQQCRACADLASEMEKLEHRIQEAALVPLPDALAERVLLHHKSMSGLRPSVFALAAALLVAIGLWIPVDWRDESGEDDVVAAAELGESHPAVMAISYVLDQEPRLLEENRTGDPAVMRAALARLGLALPQQGVSVRYLGKCPVPGGTGEHLVLGTPHGRTTLILVPDYPVGSRVLVADRDMTALMSPTRNGGYIVVARTPNVVKRTERLLI